MVDETGLGELDEELTPRARGPDDRVHPRRVLDFMVAVCPASVLAILLVGRCGDGSPLASLYPIENRQPSLPRRSPASLRVRPTCTLVGSQMTS